MPTTSIEWTDVTWNPTRGCSRVSPGCENCYAEKIAARFSEPKQPFHSFATRKPARWTRKVALVPDKLDAPLHWKKPRRIFVNSMSDLFHESLSNTAIADVFMVMAVAHWHTFQVLTKRAERMRDWFEWARQAFVDEIDRTTYADRIAAARSMTHSPPLGLMWPLPNVWLGVSVEDQQRADERIPFLLQTPAAVRYLSCEPLLGPVDLRFVDWNGSSAFDPLETHQISWVIVGGESGSDARPMALGWAANIVKQCKVTGVPCFVKQLGARPTEGMDTSTPISDFFRSGSKGGDISRWPAGLRVREWPETPG